ncbi:hypothetical protein TWF696_000926 [Orbilia brochopaga]|uniref:Uncharacterized protein n=1 Tax=Orbilia brochopaga TaxID=3140254 RepID=A0AAV9VFG6_9PEZI
MNMDLSLTSVMASEDENRGFLLARQIVRFYQDQNAPLAVRNIITPHTLLRARYLLAEESEHTGRLHPENFKLDRRAEENYPQAWFMPQEFQAAIAAFDQFVASSRFKPPSWLPSEIGGHNLAQGLENNLRFVIEGIPDQEATRQIRVESVLRKAADLAFSLLCTTKSQDALGNILKEVVQDWNDFNIAHSYRHSPDDNRSPNDLARSAVDFFLSRLRNQFPRVCIESNAALEGSDAETTRRPWLRSNESFLSFRADCPRIATEPQVDNAAFKVAVNALTVEAAREAAEEVLNRDTSPEKRTPLTVFGETSDLEEYPGAEITESERDWIDNPDWDAIPDGIQHKISGESGFRWEKDVFGGKTSCRFTESLQSPGKPEQRTSGAPHLV